MPLVRCALSACRRGADWGAMEHTENRAGATAPLAYPTPSQLSRKRLDRLRERITDSILQAAGGTDDELLGEIVRAAVRTFVDTQADVERAAGSVAHLMEQIGARQARRGYDAEDLTAAFRAALVATQKGLPLVVGDLVTRDTLVQLREDLVAYLTELQIHAHAGLVRTRRQLALAPERATRRPGHLDFGLDATTGLVPHDMLDEQTVMMALVSLAAPLPDTLLNHPRTVSGPTTIEVLVPASWNLDEVAQQLIGQAVIGPAVPLLRAGEGLMLARQAADLLRDGIYADARIAVPCVDMLSALVVHANPLLAELMIDKHLAGLRPMSLVRRVALGELLLKTLENGQPMAAAARELGIPRQTAFSRMKPLRDLFDDALRDPTQRLELAIALRVALPRWRTQLALPTQAHIH